MKPAIELVSRQYEAGTAEPVATVDLRENLAAGRGGIVEFGRFEHDWIRPPGLIVGEVTPELMRSYFGQTVVLGASLFAVRDAEVAAEGIILTDGRFNLCSQLNIDVTYPGRYHAGLAKRLKGLRRRAVDEPAVLLAGNGYRMYGHWLVDYLPKLYLLHLGGHRIDRLRVLLPVDTPDFARDWLRLVGIGDAQLLLYDPAADLLACRSLIVPSALRFLGRASPLLRAARDFLLERAAPRRRRWLPLSRHEEAPRRLLVARSENPATRNRRRLVERAAFEARAASRGFEIVHPEAMSVPDQIALFRSASVICGEYGSGLHASLFSGPGTVVMALRHNAPGLGFLQSGIGHVLDHETAYLIGGPPDADGSFSVAEQDIEMGLDWLDGRGRG